VSARTRPADPGSPNTIETPRIESAAPGAPSVPVAVAVLVTVIGLQDGVSGPVYPQITPVDRFGVPVISRVATTRW
jgi:hypothetical protein